MIGYGFAYFAWRRLMAATRLWPFYDGCSVCERICRAEWAELNPPPRVCA